MITPMNPCAHNQRLLARLVLDDLPPAERANLQAHLEGCPGCRRCWAELNELWADHQRAAEAVPETPVGETFHRRLRQRLQLEENRGVLGSLRALWRESRLMRGSLGTAAAATAVLLLVVVWTRREPSGPPGDRAASLLPAVPSAATVTVTDAPTFSNYRTALNTSPDALDELLTRHAQRSAPSGGNGPYYAFRQPLNFEHE